MKRTALAISAWASLCAALAAQPAAAPAGPPGPAPAPAPTAKTPTPPKPSSPYDPLLNRLRAALDTAADGGDFNAAFTEVAALWDWTCVHVPADQPDVFREVGGAQRMMEYLAKYTGDRRAIIRLLRSSPHLATALAFQVAPGDGEDPAAVLAALDALRTRFPAAQLEEFANLAAAVCVVYDKPLIKQVSENQAKGLSGPEVFQYYTRFEGRMVYSPRTTPPELLIYMIDPAASADELAWALDRYDGQRELGPRYSEIRYDNDHFKRGKEKKVNTEGYTLQNIRKYGGICADQAHFASTVGKAIGVPAAVDSGQASDVGHAWLGYLKKQAGRIAWNFDAGRYEDYEDVRGSVIDPQTGAVIPDGTLALSAEAFATPDAARHASTALADAATRLRKGSPRPAAGVEVAARTVDRTGTVDDRAALLRASVSLYSANHRAWNALRAMAAAKELTLDQKKQWSESLQRYCGDAYPDFTLAVLAPMVSTIDDPAQQGPIWDGLYKRFRAGRPDLAAQVLIDEGRMWEKAAQPDKAYACYTTAANQFVNKAPASVDALERCETLLQAQHQQSEIINIYAAVWRRLSKPSNMAQEFLMQSNWYRVGARYADLLDAAGQKNKSDQIRKAIGEDDTSVARRDRQMQKQKR